MTAHTKDGGPANIASYYPEHCRTSCSDAEPINACAEGSTGCARCTALALDELDRLRARVASLEESLHYANGVADLAMKHRDDAENRVAELDQDAKRYRWLRQRDLETIGVGGVFAGMTPENIVLNGDDLDNAIDAALAKAGA